MQQAISKLKDSFASGRTRPLSFRKNQLKALARLIDENTPLICEAVNKDLRKSKYETILSEVAVVRNDIKVHLSQLSSWAAPESIGRSIPTLFDKTYNIREPYGTCLIIGAWNYPFQLTVLPLVGAISAGDCAIVKPSEVSPETSHLLAQLLPRYLDNSCYEVIEGGVDETTFLLSEKFDFIFYTGSPAVGKIVYEAAAKNLTPCVLELGGKSPVFFDDNVPQFDYCVRRLLWGKLINCGQTCVAPDYILCSKQTRERLVPALQQTIRQFYGESVKDSSQYSRMVTQRHTARIRKLLDSTRGTIVCGGKTDEENKFVEPTIVTDVTLDDPLMQEEIFAPILPIYTVDSVNEAISIINSREKPLTLYVFTGNDKNFNKIRDNTSSGSISRNETLLHLTIDGLPFGGVGNSGMGSYHGKYSFEAFSNVKPVYEKSTSFLVETLGSGRYPPVTDGKYKFLSFLMEPRNLHLDKLPYVAAFTLGTFATYVTMSFVY